MFNVGDLITGKDQHYGITTEYALCVVTKVTPRISGDDLYVKIIGHTQESDVVNPEYESNTYGYEVESKYFVATTMEEYKEKYPNAYFLSDEKIAELVPSYQAPTNTTTTNKEEIIMNHMDKTTTYELTVEERRSLHSEIMNLLTDLPNARYSPSSRAVDLIIDEWVKKKGWMINLFKKHTNYNGKYQIAFDADFNRVCDKVILNQFRYYLKKTMQTTVLQEARRFCCTYSEIINHYKRLDDVCDYMESIIRRGYKDVLVHGRTLAETEKERGVWREKMYAMQKDTTLYVDTYDCKAYEKEAYALYTYGRSFADFLTTYTEHLATADFAKQVNTWFPTVKAVEGQKTSRIVGKVCKMLGIDKHPDYNREFAKYSDAINPLVIKRHTIFSCHPVDYLTMSFGNSWNSCHDIGKRDVGCYSSGTISYMLDDSSFVFYTVDKDYNGNVYELQDKINRNMFHIGEDKLIQARVYPQTTDGETGMYKQIREVAQKVIADCLEMPNMWKNVKGTGECSSRITSYGTHYTDYEYFEDCNVSYLKTSEEDIFNNTRIVVGRSPICPCCGNSHSHEESIECYDCYEDDVCCSCCGDYHDREDMEYIDGEWYCHSCCFYCEHHEQYEVGDKYRIHGTYNYICENALYYSDNYAQCNYCEDVYYIDDMIETEDGHYYCNSEHAESDGYTNTSDGEWYPEDEVYYCEHCGKYIHKDCWNTELECCEDCEDKVAEENAENESEENSEEEVA